MRLNRLRPPPKQPRRSFLAQGQSTKEGPPNKGDRDGRRYAPPLIAKPICGLTAELES